MNDKRRGVFEPHPYPSRIRFILAPDDAILGWVAQAECPPEDAAAWFQAWIDAGAWDLPPIGVGKRYTVRRTLSIGWAIIPLWRTAWPPKPSPKDGAP